MEKERIVFFDGVCNLCSASVIFMLKTNRKKNLFFAPIQSKTFISKFGPNTGSLDSIIYWKEGTTYSESDAILQISKELFFPFSLMIVLYLVPKFLRDIVYRLIARNRYSMFGIRQECFLPTDEIRARFLD